MAIFFLLFTLHAWKILSYKNQEQIHIYFPFAVPPRLSFLSNMTVSKRAIDPDFLDGAAWDDNGLCCKREAQDKIYLLKKTMFILSKSSESL